jgi:hypothetical protein
MKTITKYYLIFLVINLFCIIYFYFDLHIYVYAYYDTYYCISYFYFALLFFIAGSVFYLIKIYKDKRRLLNE